VFSGNLDAVVRDCIRLWCVYGAERWNLNSKKSVSGTGCLTALLGYLIVLLEYINFGVINHIVPTLHEEQFKILLLGRAAES